MIGEWGQWQQVGPKSWLLGLVGDGGGEEELGEEEEGCDGMACGLHLLL